MDLAHIATRFGTPLYVYDAASLRKKVEDIRAAFGPQTDLLFALKANPSLAVAQVFRRAGTGAEVASAGEIAIAKAAGFDGASIRFAGPGKSDLDLDAALDADVGCIHLESHGEYEALRERARARGLAPQVAIRINPQSKAGRLRMGGGARKFGVDKDEVLTLAHQIEEERVCTLDGLHVYAGTQISDATKWLQVTEELVELADRVEEHLGRPLKHLNFGGGFAVPLQPGEPEFDLELAGQGVRRLMAARPDRRGVIEPGRFLTAEAGVYLTRVRFVKESAEQHYAILDGGAHHHGAAAGLGMVVRRPWPIKLIAPDADSRPRRKVSLAGPLCTPTDEFTTDLEMPELQPNDLLAIGQSGAYGLTFSPVLFLSHPLPAEVVVDGDRMFLARERGRAADLLRGQHGIPASSIDLLDRITVLVSTVILQQSGRSVMPAPDQDLFETTLLERHGVHDLALALQFEFGIRLESHEISEQVLGTVREITGLVQRKLVKS